VALSGRDEGQKRSKFTLLICVLSSMHLFNHLGGILLEGGISIGEKPARVSKGSREDLFFTLMFSYRDY